VTVVREIQEDHGATFVEVGGHAVPAQYGRPERAHHAVRRVVGVTEQAYGILVITGSDRERFLRTLVPTEEASLEGQGTYLLELDDEDRIAADVYLYHAGERLLGFATPGTEHLLAERWRERVTDLELGVDITLASSEFGVFGLHGPQATEKVASVLTGPGAPSERLTFVRGRVGENGVTVIRTEALTGEVGYEVVCRAEDADRVFDALLNHGLNAAPFGLRTWETLTLEAGSPLFETELIGYEPASLSLSHLSGAPAGQTSGTIVGLRPEEVPESGADVTRDGSAVGEITRAVQSPTLEGPAALARVDGEPSTRLCLDGEVTDVEALPLVEGSATSGRLPRFDSTREH
jgi:aminomethyltransferase